MDRLGLDEYDMAIMIAVAAGQPEVAQFIGAWREAEGVLEFAKTGIPPKPPGFTQSEWESTWRKIKPKLQAEARRNPTALKYLDFKEKEIKRYDPSDKGQSPVNFQQSLLGGNKLERNVAESLMRFSQEHPNKAKLLGFGDPEKLQQLLIDMTPGINDVSGSGLLTKVINKTVDLHNKLRKKKSDPNDVRLINNEVHGVFKNKDGSLARAKFCGPGTEIVKKIKALNHKHKGDVKKMVDVSNFVSEADKICMMHDLNYYLDGKDNPEAVRKADLAMIRKLKDVEAKGESKFNTVPSKLGIKAKMKLEDVGILKPGSFANDGAENFENAKNIRLMRKVQAQLRKEGFGNVKDRPMRQQQSPWVKFVKAYAEKHDVSYRDALKQAAPLYRSQKNN